MGEINYWLSWKRLLDVNAQRCTIDWKAEFGNPRTVELEIGCGNGAWMFTYESPLGILGRIADRLFLARYLRSFLIERNRVIKATAESGTWRQYLRHA